MLVHSVRRVPPPTASSCHRISNPPQLYSSTRGASARVTVVSVTCGPGAPTVVSFTLLPTLPRLPSASNGAHSRSISNPPELDLSTRGASARVTVVSVTCGPGAPTVVSFTLLPTLPRLPSASNGAHSRSCAGSVSACQTCSGA